MDGQLTCILDSRSSWHRSIYYHQLHISSNPKCPHGSPWLPRNHRVRLLLTRRDLVSLQRARERDFRHLYPHFP
jgi:hypothetical protein